VREPVPFLFSADGDVLICGDGPELLVYSAVDGSPRWKLFGDDVVVGLAQAANEVVAVDAAGNLQFYRALDGRLDRTVALGVAALGLAGSDSGAVGVITSAGVHVLPRGGAPRLVSAPGATAAAFGPGGGSLGVGTSDGRFIAIDPASGGAWGEIALGGPVGGVAWSARGHWVVTAGARWLLVSGDGSSVVAELSALEAAGGPVAVSSDGLIAATVVGLNEVHVAELYTNAAAGSLTFRRAVGDLSFGPGAQLGIGLDDGDGMCMELHSQNTVRTEPHPGRGRNAWNMDAQLDGGMLRGALANATVAGASIAVYTGPKPPEPTPWWKVALGVGGGCMVLIGGTMLLLMVTSWALYMRGLI
jgi:hypothetical protein